MENETTETERRLLWALKKEVEARHRYQHLADELAELLAGFTVLRQYRPPFTRDGAR